MSNSTDFMKEIRRKDKISRWVGLGLIVLGLTIAIGYLVSVTKPPYPLKFTRVQNVVRDPAVFHLDEPVIVEANFLNTTDHTVTYGGAVHWVLVSPNSGTEIIQFQFTSQVEPGCKKFVFTNNPPQSVVDLTKQLFGKGNKEVTWQLSGDNIILVPSGGSLQFQVEKFTYVPDDQTLPKFEDKHDVNNCDNL